MADLLVNKSIKPFDPKVYQLPDHPTKRKEDKKKPDPPSEVKPLCVIPELVKPLPLIARTPNFRLTSISKAGEILLWTGVSSVAAGIVITGGGAVGDITRSLHGNVMSQTTPAGLGVGVVGFTMIIASFVMIATKR